MQLYTINTLIAETGWSLKFSFFKRRADKNKYKTHIFLTNPMIIARALCQHLILLRLHILSFLTFTWVFTFYAIINYYYNYIFRCSSEANIVLTYENIFHFKSLMSPNSLKSPMSVSTGGFKFTYTSSLCKLNTGPCLTWCHKIMLVHVKLRFNMNTETLWKQSSSVKLHTSFCWWNNEQHMCLSGGGFKISSISYPAVTDVHQ